MLLLRSTKIAKNLKRATIAIPPSSIESVKHSQYLTNCMHRTAAAVSKMSSPLFSPPLFFSFSTNPEKTSLYLIKSACDYLVCIDAVLIEDLSLAFGRTYVLSERLKDDS